MEKKAKPVVVLSAGGNQTAIFFVPDSANRANYPKIARRCLKVDSRVEQVGFLEGNRHLEMSGGEFCGNAARAAALLIARRTSRTDGWFTISGFEGKVIFSIRPRGHVRCEFPKFNFQITEKIVPGVFGSVKIVDLGGIVHAVLSSANKFISQPKFYQIFHRKLVRVLKLSNRSAVGVVWQSGKVEEKRINPVVWVKKINSFFYETACGSGTIAALLASRAGRQKILQPSGGVISVERKRQAIILESEMRILN